MIRIGRLLATIAVVATLVVAVRPVAADEASACGICSEDPALSWCEAMGPQDWGVPNGRFFTQTGTPPMIVWRVYYWLIDCPGAGFAIIDSAGIPFWTTFQEAGGVPQLGYPVSRRWTEGGFTYQAFQKAILQWQPGVGMFYVNIYDRLHHEGLDGWLEAAKSTPPPRDFPQDADQPWEVVKENHLALLDENPAIKAKWYENANWENAYGLPVGWGVFGDAWVLRAQRAVLQQWMIDVPWAAAGEVVISNGGDIYKEAGLIPAFQTVVEPANGYLHLYSGPPGQFEIMEFHHGTWLSHDSIGTPKATVGVRNTSNATIDAFDFEICAFNNYGEPVPKYGWGSGCIAATASDTTLLSGEAAAYTVPLYGQGTATSFTASPIRSHTTDGDTWRP